MSKTNRFPSPKPPTSYNTAIALGILGAGSYLLIAYVIAVLTGPEFTGGAYGLLLVYSVLSVGIPIVLWFRYGLKGPLVLVVAILVFWHIIVPLFGSEGDGTPIFAVAVAMAPLYLGGYLLAAGLEFWLR